MNSHEVNNRFPMVEPPMVRYRPVVIVHGLMTGDVSTMERLAVRISELHPCTKTYVINRFCGISSLEPLWRQTAQLRSDLMQICALHPEGVHVIGYSQGGLIARGMLEMCGIRHNVKTFVSLSSPQGGQYGAECFTKIFPTLTTRTAYELFYTRLGQYTLSVANYWYDPRHRDLFLKYSLYLAVIDNAKDRALTDSHLQNHLRMMITNYAKGYCPLTTDNIVNLNDFVKTVSIKKARALETVAIVDEASLHVAEDAVGDYVDKFFEDALVFSENMPEVVDNCSQLTDILTCDIVSNETNTNKDSDFTYASTRRLGITRLQRMVLIGGPDDGVISPWQSSQFAVLDSAGELVPMRERLQDDIYSDNDPIGLRQLDRENRIIEYTVPGVHHHEWHRNDDVLQDCIIQWLD